MIRSFLLKQHLDLSGISSVQNIFIGKKPGFVGNV